MPNDERAIHKRAGQINWQLATEIPTVTRKLDIITKLASQVRGGTDY